MTNLSRFPPILSESRRNPEYYERLDEAVEHKMDIESQDQPLDYRTLRMVEDKPRIRRYQKPAPEQGPNNHMLTVVTVGAITAWILAGFMWAYNKWWNY